MTSHIIEAEEAFKRDGGRAEEALRRIGAAVLSCVADDPDERAEEARRAVDRVFEEMRLEDEDRRAVPADVVEVDFKRDGNDARRCFSSTTPNVQCSQKLE